MRRDRYGDLVDLDDGQLDDEHQAATHQPHQCDGGWLDRDADNPVPCLRCRPHLAPQARPPRPDPARILAGVQRCRAELAARRRATRGAA